MFVVEEKSYESYLKFRGSGKIVFQYMFELKQKLQFLGSEIFLHK